MLAIALPACATAQTGAQTGAQTRAQTGAQKDAPFTVAIDAAHGGEETGTTLSPGLLEKDLVLTLSVRLRSALNARGIAVVTTREGDVDPSAATRAGEANHARAAACLVLHATASGSGVHLYTSSLDQGAGAPFATASLQLSSELSTALGAAAIPFTLGRVRMEPLDALECPAVAVEVAPLRRPAGEPGPDAAIEDAGYQSRVVDALAAALVAWRSDGVRR